MAAGQNGQEDVKRMSLAYRDIAQLSDYLKKKICEKNIEILDLTGNHFSLKTLRGLTRLQILILDSNLLESHVVFPPLPNLEILWINKNKIDKLTVFVEMLSTLFPKLKHLSMMNNPAAPSYFNGGSVAEYKDYRMYVISRLPALDILDDQSVTDEERSEAGRIYPNPVINRVKKRGATTKF